MKNYFKKWDRVVGWAIFATAFIVYLLTMEPTTSLWDCSEFIATSYKLEVGHPPGAPLFMMIARLFTIFAPSTDAVPVMVNAMSSLCSAFTILFLFWTITHFARKIYGKTEEEISDSKDSVWTVLGAGIIGALTYTFSDSFWFSAVEGEVYAMSSMFTAMVVWMMLQWEKQADSPRAMRWLILIAYMMGLSVGVHILNLLTIPALVFIFYFRKTEKVSFWGVVGAFSVAAALLVAINYVLVPLSVKVGAGVDRLFVNGFGLRPNIGITVFAFLMFGLFGWLIYFTHKRGYKLANIIVLCTAVLTLGFASYASITIRAVANPPMNSNNPDNPYALLSLLNRDQYGDRPLLYGASYAAPAIEYKTKTMYSMEWGKYASREAIVGVEYPAEFKGLFPRMHSSRHEDAYKSWVNIKGRAMPFGDEVRMVPTAGENLQYFFGHQLNFMYWRYFMWNFVGRQSDTQADGGLLEGNWLSGIDVIDQMYLGPQDDLPDLREDNKGRNTYYFLPFILGLIGLVYQLNRDRRNFSVVMLLFLMMGIVLVFYFNSAPDEPRERDYVYAGSFYAFSIWIGFSVLFFKELLDQFLKRNKLVNAVVATLICSCVPIVLAAQNWDDHNRSGRYVAKDVGWNYLQSTLPNSIIMNYGDNDTFPLWYNQEVDGVRLDVRIMNLSYLGGDWYIDQMKIRSNESAAVPFSLSREKYAGTTNDFLFVDDIVNGKPQNIKGVMNYVGREDQSSKKMVREVGGWMDFIPAKNLYIPVDKEKVLKSGIVKQEDAHLIEDAVYIQLGDGGGVTKPTMMLLDLLANFNWERPLYFTQLQDISKIGLLDYLQFDGYAYRLVPIKTEASGMLQIGRIDSDYLYKNIMETFRYGNVEDPRVYTDTFTQNNFNSTNSRNAFARLAKQLMIEGDTTRAVSVLDEGLARMPYPQIRNSYRLTMPHIESYYLAGEMDKANKILEDYAEEMMQEINYLVRFEGRKLYMVRSDLETAVGTLDHLLRLAMRFEQSAQTDMINDFYFIHNTKLDQVLEY